MRIPICLSTALHHKVSYIGANVTMQFRARMLSQHSMLPRHLNLDLDLGLAPIVRGRAMRRTVFRLAMTMFGLPLLGKGVWTM